jgi:hypothetical protein
MFLLFYQQSSGTVTCLLTEHVVRPAFTHRDSKLAQGGDGLSNAGLRRSTVATTSCHHRFASDEALPLLQKDVARAKLLLRANAGAPTISPLPSAEKPLVFYHFSLTY